MIPEFLGPLALGVLIGALAALVSVYLCVEIDFVRDKEIMPVDLTKYPDNWDEIAFAIKEEAGWQCECCGKQCRRPGEPFDTHKRTLTVAHCNHDESDCRPENLAAMCAPCHLRYDASHHAENAARTRREKWEKRNKNQLQLFPGYAAHETDLSALQQ